MENAFKLIGSHTSPFVRKLRIFMGTHNIPFEFQAINYLEENDAAFLKKINPINKIPVLFNGTDAIFESRVIYNYLCDKHNIQKLSLHEENILSASDELLETLVGLFQLKRSNIDINQDLYFLKRQRERIPSIINYLNDWAEGATSWNFVSMSLFSTLYWANFREMINLNDYPHMKKFVDKFSSFPHVDMTNIPS